MSYIKKLHYNSPVILTFTFICLFTLLAGYISNGYTTSLLFSVYRSNLYDPLTFLRLFTHVLGHSNFQHFFNNFLILLIIGPMLEEKYGSRNIFILIIITAFITGIVQIILSDNALLGASGIAFMFIGLTSFVNIEKGKVPITTLLIIILYFGKELYYGIMYKDNISRLTHIIGGVCGIILGYIINRELNFKRFTRR